MTQQPSADLEHPQPTPKQSVWQENHGNLLLAFVAFVLLVGAAILLYRQNRFVPVRFPDASAISLPTSENGEFAVKPGDAVTLFVSGAVNDSGVMRVALYETPQSFNDLEQAFLRSTVPIQEGNAEMLVPFELLPEKFAIAVFHDENEDGTLNRNRFGIPNERYGFSENARGLTGPPSFEDALTSRPDRGGKLLISIR